MKKQIIAIVTATVLAAPAIAIAADNQWFIGADVGMDTGAWDGHAGKYDEQANYGIKFGKHLGDNDQHRVYFTYGENKMGEKGDAAKAKDFLMSYDYMIGLNEANTFKAFAGVTAGMSRVSYDGLGSQNDLAYGAQAGLTYDFNKNFGIEGGYQYLKREASKNGINMPEDNRLYVGANYKF